MGRWVITANNLHQGGAAVAGMELHERHQISDERGAVLHVLRRDAAEFREFGEVYCSEILPGAVKAWKQQGAAIQNLVVPVGRVELVVYDERQDSPTYGNTLVCELGRPDCYWLAVIPPLTWYGFRGLAAYPSLIVNCATQAHDPSKVRQRDAQTLEIPHVWATDLVKIPVR